MGFFLDCPRDVGKADYLITAFGAVGIAEPDYALWYAISSDLCVVAVVEYPTHEAAGIAFDEREFFHIKRSLGGGSAPYRWLLMRKRLAALHCPAYANWLAKGPSPDAQRQAGEN